MALSYVPPPSTGEAATALDTFAYWGLLTVGVLVLGLMVALNVVSVWWVVRRYARTPPIAQRNEDDPGWLEHAERVVASELEVARQRGDQLPPPQD